MMIYHHEANPQMQAEVILASRGSNGAPPIYTLRLRYPRIIHAEIMTHRAFSRNARSSRAVPVKTMLDEVRNAPFVPWHWGKNQKGMQAGEECNELVRIPDWEDVDMGGAPKTYIYKREEAWLQARDKAVDVAAAMMEAGYHKQIPNRLLEPFAWIDTLITATDWKNFLWLRDHKDAEPHLQDLARLVKHALDHVVIQELEEDDWHLPYITRTDYEYAMALRGNSFEEFADFLCRISAARCARISYAPFDGDASYERELERYDSLVKSDRVHASPLEHAAMVGEGLSGNFAKGWIQYRKTISGECVYG